MMREAYALFKDGGDPEKVSLFELQCIYISDLCPYKFLQNVNFSWFPCLQLASGFSSSSDGELFYASLYAGLYYESQVQIN